MLVYFIYLGPHPLIKLLLTFPGIPGSFAKHSVIQLADNLIYIIYASAATQRFSEEELVELLNSCRQNNKKRSITGMLLYCQEQFIQVIEGPQPDVVQLFENIKTDPRQSSVLKLFEKPIEERCFSQWSMGFHSYNTEELDRIEGYHSFRETFEQKGNVTTQQANVVFRLLKTFVQTMCHKTDHKKFTPN